MSAWNAFTLWVIALSTHAATVTQPDLDFTAQERAYLEKTTAIRMCVDPDWVPFEQLNAQGEHVGIAADLVQLVGQRVGLKIQVLPVKSWEESLAASKAGRCQVMSFLNQTPVREQWLRFTQPIFHDQNIIITREEHPFIGDPKNLSDETVVLPHGTMIEERIRQDFPKLKVITTESEVQAMALVSERKADLTVRSLIVAAYAIKKEGLFNLKISGQIPEYTNQLRIGVLKSEPVLRDILDKGVATITSAEREAITNKHVAIQVQQGVDYSLVLKVVVVGGAALLLVLAWNRKLKALNQKLARLAVTDPLTGLNNRYKAEEILEHEIQRSWRFDQPFSVILLELEGLAQTPGRLDHPPVADAARIAVAKLLQTHTRETDLVSLWHGAKFIIIAPQTELVGALKLAKNLRHALTASEILKRNSLAASFGVATYLLNDQQQDITARAESALHKSRLDASHVGFET